MMTVNRSLGLRVGRGTSRWRSALLATALTLACDKSRETLLAGLQSPRPSDRVWALKKLGEQGRAEDLVLFLRAAKDPAAPVRAVAAESLGATREPQVADTLSDLLLDSDEAVQGKAAMALGELRTEKAKAYLLAQFGRQGRSTRHAIVQALRVAGVNEPLALAVGAESKALWEHNLRMSVEGSLAERAVAAEELGQSGRSEAVEHLVRLTVATQVALAAAAARGLGEAGDRQAVAALTELLQENSPELRQAACEALGKLQAVEALLQLEHVSTEKSAASPAATAALLALPRSAQTDRVLCEVALAGSPADVAATGREMRKRGGCPLEPILAALSQRPKPSKGERVTLSAALGAVEALGPTARKALPGVLLSLRDPRLAIRSQAMAALAEIADPSSRQELQSSYEEESRRVDELRLDWIPGPLPKSYAPGFEPPTQDAPSKADKLLKSIADRSSDPQDAPPTELVEDVPLEQLQLLSNALRALGALGVSNLQPMIADRTRDPSPIVRAGAYAGLTLLEPQAQRLAARGLDDPDPSVRSLATQALAAQDEGQRILVERLESSNPDTLLHLEALSRVKLRVSPIQPLRNLISRGGAEAALAASILGNLGDPEAAQLLIARLETRGNDGRKEALLALSHVGNQKAADVVARDLYHDSADIRAAAAQTLAEIGGPAQLESLRALKGDYYRRVREAAELAISKIGTVPKTDKTHGTQ
jgi:HEAT repeat protein